MLGLQRGVVTPRQETKCPSPPNTRIFGLDGTLDMDSAGIRWIIVVARVVVNRRDQQAKEARTSKKASGKVWFRAGYADIRCDTYIRSILTANKEDQP